MRSKSRKSVKPQATQATKPEGRLLKPHEVVLSAALQSTVGVYAWSKFAGEVELHGLHDDVRARVQQVEDGDMAPVEAMLFGQAKTLEAIFTSLALRASGNDSLKQFQVNLTLALKAQAQCRATLEALAEIKNPRSILFTKQANISGGHQQVNNSSAPPVTSGGASTSQSNSAAVLPAPSDLDKVFEATGLAPIPTVGSLAR